jgi:hypothetical protein
MKATLLTEQMGLPAGEVVEVETHGPRTCVVKASAELSVSVPTAALQFDAASLGKPVPEPEEATSEEETTDEEPPHADGWVPEPEEATSEEETTEVESAGDEDLDEPLPERTCTDEEGCTSCQ